MKPSRSLVLLALAWPASVGPAHAAGLGRLLPSEKRTVVDEVTAARIEFLTTAPANDSKPYQPHTTWTADGMWVLMRSDRAGSGPQGFLVNEQSGAIVQVTEGLTDTGSFNLSRKENALYYVRRRPGMERELVHVRIDPLV